jgi:hypothetical protein
MMHGQRNMKYKVIRGDSKDVHLHMYYEQLLPPGVNPTAVKYIPYNINKSASAVIL